MHRREHALDTLRFGAVMLVVCYHLPPLLKWQIPAGLLGFMSYGWMGVDLFFVLSGYLIGGLILRELNQTGDLKLLRFWWRRWMRTLPAYYSVLLFINGVDWLSSVERTWDHRLAYFFFLQNYLSELLRFSWTWSLCVEEHFYLFLPLIILCLTKLLPNLTPKQTFRLLVGLALSVTVASRVLVANRIAGQHLQDHQLMQVLTSVTHCRLDGLAIGLFVATLHGVQRKFYSYLSIGVVLAVAVTLVMFHTEWFIRTFGYFIIALGFGALVYYSTRENRWAQTSLPGMRFGADLAYSLFLTHPIVFRMLELRMASLSTLTKTALALGLSLLASLLLRYLVELPLLRLRDRLFAKKLPLTAAIRALPTG